MLPWICQRSELRTLLLLESTTIVPSLESYHFQRPRFDHWRDNCTVDDLSTKQRGPYVLDLCFSLLFITRSEHAYPGLLLRG